MTLSNRLWRAIAYRVAECLEPVCCLLWAKVEWKARGKRHYIRTIHLTEEEFQLVKRVIAEASDDYFLAILKHERETNPGMAA